MTDMKPDDPTAALRRAREMLGTAWSAAVRVFLEPDPVVTAGLDAARVGAYHARNRRQTALLAGSMAALLLVAGALLAGGWGIVLVLASLAAMVLIGPRATPEKVMLAYGAEKLGHANGRTFVALLEEIARRAELPRAPDLYVIPSATLNAFAVGTPERATIALTEGLVRRLNLRELAGVLAHEVSHVRNGDLWVMGLADGMTRLARALSLTALVLMVLNLTSLVTGVQGLSWIGLLLLYLTPAASSLLQLALSRTREFDADLDGVTLTGDAEGLANALAKLETYRGHVWEDLVYPMRRVPQPSLLRSHPATQERLERLREIAATPAAPARWPRLAVIDGPLVTALAGLGASAMQPRYRWKAGVWF